MKAHTLLLTAAFSEQMCQVASTPVKAALDETVDVLYTLISFECFDTLAGPTRSLEEVAPVVQRCAWAVLGLDEGQPAGDVAGNGGE